MKPASQLFRRLARHLARTRWGREALAQDPDFRVFKSKPTPRVWLGLVLMGSSYLLSLAGLALVGYLAHRYSRAWILVGGGVAVFIVVHLIFLAGVYLAGANYGKALAVWGLRKFITKYHPQPSGNGDS